MGLKGNGKFIDVVIKYKMEGEVVKFIDYFILFFGFLLKLGLIVDWGLNIDKNVIEVDIFDYSMNVLGIYVVGDINIYFGKFKFIFCGFYEVILMV